VVLVKTSDMTDTTSTLCAPFAVRTRVGFTGSVGRKGGATLVMVNTKAIKCTKEGFSEDRDIQVVSFCVVAAHAEGMMRAPFKYNDQRKGAARPVTKPLTAMTANGGMQFWTWQRKGTDKGERMDDDSWTLSPGTTLKMFFREEDIAKGVLGDGSVTEIPAFSLCEVQLVPKSSDPCGEGWGINVRCVMPSALSLYSYASLLPKMPTSAEDAKLRAIAMGDANPQMHRQIEQDGAMFAQVPIGSDAHTEYVESKTIAPRKEGDPSREQEAFVRVWNCIPGSPCCVDVSEDVLLAYTNSTTLDSAMRLFEVATALECVSIMTFGNEYRGKNEGLSEFSGAPLLDTEKLLACVRADNLVEGTTDTFVVSDGVKQFSEKAQPLWVVVGVEEDSGAAFAVQPTSDLILCETLEQCGRGVPLSFMLGGDKTLLWKGYMNTSTVQMMHATGATCPQRRKWASL
jgi:hypothetical protein